MGDHANNDAGLPAPPAGDGLAPVQQVNNVQDAAANAANPVVVAGNAGNDGGPANNPPTQAEANVYQCFKVMQGQGRINGERYMENRRTMLVGISLGNPYFSKEESLEQLFQMTERSTDKVLIVIPDKISEHNYRAVGSQKPEQSARKQGNQLRNKCKRILESKGFSLDKYTFINWTEDVEPNPHYHQALKDMEDLYKNNERFQTGVQELIKKALDCFLKRHNNCKNKADTTATFDLEEGVKYVLKEVAFVSVLPHIFDDCDEFVLVYHRVNPVFDNFFEGFYDGRYRPAYGFFQFP